MVSERFSKTSSRSRNYFNTAYCVYVQLLSNALLVVATQLSSTRMSMMIKEVAENQTPQSWASVDFFPKGRGKFEK